MKQINLSSNKSSISTKSAFSSSNNFKSNLKTSSIFDLDNDLDFLNVNNDEENENKYDNYKKEIVDYIMKNTSPIGSINTFSEIEKKVEDINEGLNIYEINDDIEKWYKEHLNEIKNNDKKVMEELINVNLRINININIPLSFNYLKRSLLSFSIQYDWTFIKKVKSIEKSISAEKNQKKNNSSDNIDMLDNNNDELGLNYLDNLDNIGNDSANDFNSGSFNLKSSFFGY